ncbi:hypothetical protein [Tenacibaculum sp. 190524A05c]|uniref:hypothetical protein n=1 Tax=Tenacibaculum platacis TaxID=3137852 RepID=UPI0032B139E5
MGKHLSQIHLNISDFLKDNGFKLIKSKDVYEKKQGDFKFIIRFFSHTRSYETAIEMSIYIEHLPTSKIYKKATSFKYLVGTIGNEIGKIRDNDENEIKSHFSENIVIESEADVKEASNIILNLYDSIANPYFNKYGSLHVIDKILNDSPNIISVHRNDQYNRYSLGLIIARLNNRENYDELEKTYNELIKEMADIYIERYELVKKYLKEALDS